MIFDMRTYTCRPGTIATQLKLYEDHGLKAQQRHLGQPYFYAVTETGTINTFVHIWQYKDAADRAARRAAMAADPEWQEYVRRTGELGALVHQVNQIMTPTAFFAPKA